MAALPPADVKSPPAYNVLPDTASASTGYWYCIPDPTSDQLVPFHCATEELSLNCSVAKLPPAYNVLPDTTSANTPLFRPDPTSDQALPFHWAT